MLALLEASWLDQVGDYGRALTTALGVAAPLVGLFFAIRSRYRQTLGRRRERYQRLARLGVGAQLSFFISVLKDPPAMRRTLDGEVTEFAEPGHPMYDPAKVTPGDIDNAHEVKLPKNYTECFFIDRDYYVQTISDDDETILAFSVTTRNQRFTPTFTRVPEPSWVIQLKERVQIWITLIKLRREGLRRQTAPVKPQNPTTEVVP
jgi:hypothetical protein